MSEEKKSTDRLEQVREIFRELEAHPMSYDPEFARTYAGEWVAMHRGKVVAHGTDASAVAQEGNAQKYPGALMFHVPTIEKQEGVWLLDVYCSET